MSAYVPSIDHIDLLVTRMIGHGANVDHVRYYLDPKVGAPDPGGWEKIPPALLTRGSFGHDLLEVNHFTADVVGLILLEEAIASVSYRYPDDELIELPGVDAENILETLVRYSYRPTGSMLPPAHVIKACHGYSYQSCEHPGWETSLAKALVDSLVDKMIGQVPGYEAGPWEYHRPKDPEPISLMDIARRNRGA